MNKTTSRLLLAIGLLAVASAQAGSLEPPAGPVSPTRPPDTCFDNAGRYAVCGDGTVKDNLTGLFWLEDANCLIAQSWPDANISAAQLAGGQCGLTDGSLPGDWRLPTREEWEVIVNAAIANDCSSGPAVPDVLGTGCCGTGTCAFSGVRTSSYWSATTDASIPDQAWIGGLDASFLPGVYSTLKPFQLFAWPVRVGP